MQTCLSYPGQQDRCESDSAVINNLLRKGWTIIPAPPEPEAPPPTPPGWPNVQAFMTAFTMPEIAAVSLSTDPTIAALRLTLSTWLGRVEVPDIRVQTGLNKMVELGIISADRKAEIEAQAT